MAADVASLGLAVDSGPLVQATGRLGQFSGAAEKASGSAKGLGTATEQMARNVQRLSNVVGSVGNFSSFTNLIGRFGPAAFLLGVLADAAMGFYRAINDNAPTANDNLRAHERILSGIKSAYDANTDSARKYFETTRNVLELQAQLRQVELKTQLQQEARPALQGMITGTDLGSKINAIFPGTVARGTAEVRKEFEAFEDAVIKFRKSIMDGTPAVREFQDALSGIGKADPQIEKQAGDLLKMTEAGRATELELDKINASLKLIREGGKNLTERERGILGLPDATKLSVTASAVDDVGQAIERQIASMSKRNTLMLAEANGLGMNVRAQAELRAEMLLHDTILQRMNGNQAAANLVIRKYSTEIEKAKKEAGEAAVAMERAQDALALVNVASNAASGFFRDLANGVKPAEAIAKAFQGIGESLIDIGTKKLVGNLFESLIGDTASMTTGATTAATILNGAGASVATQIVTAATTAAGILGTGGATAGTAIGTGGTVASTAVTTSGTVAGGSIASGGLAAALGLTGAAASLAAALGPIALIGVGLGAIFGFGGGGDKKRREEEQRRLQEQFDREEEVWKLRDRQAALRDPRGIAGDLAKFDRDAAWQRLEESKKGGHNLVMLEQTLSMERLKIVEDYNAEVLKRQQTFQDRLFSATNDNDTFAGAIAEFERNAARERADELRAGGEAMADLEAALAAERLGILRSFADRAADVERGAINAALSVAQSDVNDRRQDVTEAYNREAEALRGLISTAEQAIETFSKFRQSLLLNDNLSPLNAEQKYLEAQRQARDLVSRFEAGDASVTADQVTGALQAYLDQSRSFNASSEAYYRDFQETQSITARLEQAARASLSYEQQNLARLDAQVAGLITVNSSILSVRDAITALASAQRVQVGLSGGANDNYSSQVMSLYRDILGRAPDASGAAYWQYKIDQGQSIDLIMQQFRDAARANGQLPGYANGTNFHPGGWSMVGERGPEPMYVPRGAQIVPNEVWRGAGNDNKALVAKVEELTSTVNRLIRVVGESDQKTQALISQGNDKTDEMASQLKKVASRS